MGDLNPRDAWRPVALLLTERLYKLGYQLAQYRFVRYSLHVVTAQLPYAPKISRETLLRAGIFACIVTP